MTIKNFPGLAIGGPLDGQLVENTSARFQVLMNEPIRPVVPGPLHVADLPVPITYTHISTQVGIHFWLSDGETLESALTKLALVYIQSKQ